MKSFFNCLFLQFISFKTLFPLIVSTVPCSCKTFSRKKFAKKNNYLTPELSKIWDIVYFTLKIRAAAKLQASVTNEAIYDLSSIRMMHENYHIFTSSPYCYASVMKENVNPVTYFSKKNIARVDNFLFKVELQALFYSLQLWQKGTSPTHFFSWNYQSSSSFDQMFQEVSERLHCKASLSKARKASRYQAFAYALQSKCSEKNGKYSRKTPKSAFCFNNITT